MLSKVFSFQVGCSTTLLAAIIGLVLYAIWAPLAYLAIPIWIALWLWTVFDRSVAIRCPHCHEKMNLYASVCHHCGRDVIDRQGAEL